MSDNKNGLFDSDDEDDVQYNPDEGSDDGKEEQPDSSTGQAYTPVSVPTPVPAPQAAKPVQEDEEEEKIGSSLPAPTPARPMPITPSVPTGSVEDESEFRVTDPVNTGHITYTIHGRDEDGEFEGSRRYNDFYHLHASLLTRWPGTFVPAIPSKKAVGNKDDKYIEHRRHFLQRFLRKIGQLPHLLNSDEFKLFARPSGEIEKMLAMMPRLSPEAIVERFKLHLHVDEFPDDFLVKQCREVINDFGAFCKKILPTLKVVRESAAKMVPVKAAQNSNYKNLIDIM